MIGRSWIENICITAIFFLMSVVVFNHGNGALAFEAEPAKDPADILGLWRTPDNVLIEIRPCDDSVCGIVVWFEALEGATEPVLDTKNEDESLRSREIKGLEMIYGFKKTKKGWRKGRIYDPGSGKTYKSKLTRLNNQTLRVEGCVGPFCKKFIWIPEVQ